LRSHVDPRGLGRIFDASTGFELPSGDTLEPDVSFVSRERWEAGPRPKGNQFARIVPSLVVEILSPSTARRDRTEKLEIYAENGVEEYWVIDPRRREITVYRRPGDVFDAPTLVTNGPIPSALLPDLDARAEDIFADMDE
jgi:Uma2 family endonuclease